MTVILLAQLILQKGFMELLFELRHLRGKARLWVRLKKLVVQGLGCSQSLAGVEDEELIDQIERRLVNRLVLLLADLLQVSRQGALVGAPRLQVLVVSERDAVGPGALVGGTAELLDFFHLAILCVALEEDLSGDELGKNAADTPHVDLSAVVGLTEKQLWRAIPERDDFDGVPLARGLGSSEAKIGQGHQAFVV